MQASTHSHLFMKKWWGHAKPFSENITLAGTVGAAWLLTEGLLEKLRSSLSSAGHTFQPEFDEMREPRLDQNCLGTTKSQIKEAVIKSAASAASPEGFPSRDPVGR